MLMLPGPTDIPDEAYRAMSNRLVNHRGKEFRKIHGEIIEKLRKILYTKHDVFVLTCSSTGGIEAAVSNMVDRKDSVLAFVYGQFCDRFAKAASFYSDEVSRVEIDWGKAPTLHEVKEALDNAGQVDVVLLVHNETSTGAYIPNLGEVARECRRRGAYVIVDCVTSVGGVPVKFDELDVDVIVAGTQKCLAAPPGLTILAVKDRAWDKIASKGKRPFYFDLMIHKEFMEKGETPFTPAISLLYGLDASLSRILRIGAERWFDMHSRGAAAFYDALDSMGLEIYPERQFRSKTLIAVKTPRGIIDKDVARVMAEKYGVYVGVGVAKEKGRMLRIGNMGLVSAERTVRTIYALGEALKELGYSSGYDDVAERVSEYFRG